MTASTTRDSEGAPRLSDPTLLRMQCRIGAHWCDADDAARVEVRNPATGKSIGSVPDMGAAETRRAIDAAAQALPAWSARTAGERAKLLRRLHDEMLAQREDLAVLLTCEGGKLCPEWRALILKYPGRFMIGSDTWVNERWDRYDELMKGYRVWLGDLPADVARKIAWDNAAGLFDVK